jgi:hypothetical protein
MWCTAPFRGLNHWAHRPLDLGRPANMGGYAHGGYAQVGHTELGHTTPVDGLESGRVGESPRVRDALPPLDDSRGWPC